MNRRAATRAWPPSTSTTSGSGERGAVQLPQRRPPLRSGAAASAAAAAAAAASTKAAAPLQLPARRRRAGSERWQGQRVAAVSSSVSGGVFAGRISFQPVPCEGEVERLRRCLSLVGCCWWCWLLWLFLIVAAAVFVIGRVLPLLPCR